MRRKLLPVVFMSGVAGLITALVVFVSPLTLAKVGPQEAAQGVVQAAWSGPSLSSAFAVQNRSNVAATVVVDYYNPDGSIVAGASQSASVGPKSVANFAAPMAGPWNGSAVVSSDQDVVAMGNVADDWSAPTSFGTFNGFTSAGTGTTMYLPFVVRERPSGRNSMFGVQNAGGSAANVTISYYPLGSGTSAKNEPVTIPVGASVIRNMYSDEGTLGSFAGYVKAVSTNGVPIAASLIDVATGAQYSYSGVNAPSAALYAPFIAANRGGVYPNGTNTAWAVLNTSGVAATVNVIYTGSAPGVGSVSVPQSVQIGPYQMWNWAHYNTPGLPTGFMGSAKLTTGSPVLVGIVNQTVNSAFADPGNKTSYVLAPLGTSNIALPALWRNQVSGANNKTSAIAIMNQAAVPANITLTFTPRPGSGNPLVITQNNVPANSLLNIGLGWNAGSPIDMSGLGSGPNSFFFGGAEVTSSAGPIVAIVNTSVTNAADSLGTYNGFNY